MRTEYKATFQPSGRSVFVLEGTTVFEAAVRAGLLLLSPCGGKGTCGKCRVRMVAGPSPATASARDVFSAGEIDDGFRLACQARIEADTIVDVPESSLFETHQRILTATTGSQQVGVPAVCKTYVELPPPTDTDPVSDLARLERVTGPLQIPLPLLQDLPGALRRNEYRGTAAVYGSELLALEAGHTEDECFGVAVDLGTTTIVAVLMDLRDGRELAVTAAMNPQINEGDDVISRITKTREDPAALAALQAAAVNEINRLIAEAAEQAGIRTDRIYDVTVAGNTTMLHLFCGLSPAALGELPFPPVYSRALCVPASALGLQIHDGGKVYVFPVIGGFVGGDTVAGILATSLHTSEDPVLFVDVGTNGEIVLAHAGRLLATSTAAGPAFEGARITAGMRATDGAIEKISHSGEDLLYNVIGNTAPSGICGTALIDVTAEMLRLGVLDSSGRVLAASEVDAAVPGPIRERLHEQDGQVDFLLVAAAETSTGTALYLRQRDIRELQLATGAIRAGIRIMLRRAELEPEDLARVLIAGGFGNFIRRSNACRIGLLPPLPRERVQFVGNASSMGAKTVLAASEQRETAARIATITEHVDLSMDPEFQMEFGMAMLFPESE